MIQSDFIIIIIILLIKKKMGDNWLIKLFLFFSLNKNIFIINFDLFGLFGVILIIVKLFVN